MSTARLNVWITQQGDPCRIENKKTLFVHVLHCNGEPLEWCGKKYLHLPARCGHLDLEIPPGCYIVGAVENPQGIPPLGNHLTHVAIVRADCGEEVCVTLFNPTFHHCAHWFNVAIRDHLTAGQIVPRELNAALRNAVQAVEGVVKAIPPDPFTTQHKRIDETPLPKLTQSAGKAAKGKRSR